MGSNVSELPGEGRLLADVNAISIGLVESHPGYDHIHPLLNAAATGPGTLLLSDYFPLRAQHVMTNFFGVSTVDARNSIQALLRQPIQLVCADQGILLDAYRISAEKNHDVYDCFLVALAREYDADAIFTTDGDFEDLCADEPFDYLNPVPERILQQFESVSG